MDQLIYNFFSSYKSISFDKHEIILYGDEILNNIFYLKSGFIKVYRISEQGEELTLTILKPNDFYPLTAGINILQHGCCLEALSPLEIWKVPQKHFLEFLKENPQIFYELTDAVLRRYEGLLFRMEHLVIGDAYTKIATTIFACSERFGEKKGNRVFVNLPLTHKDIAALVGITRETTCLEMKKLEKKGIISYLGRSLVVEDLQALKEESLGDQPDNESFFALSASI